MAHRQAYYLLAFLLFGQASCKKESPHPPAIIDSGKVIITNEGNFGWGDGSVSLYDPKTRSVQLEAYKTVNGESPGNVLQSVCRIGDRYYFVVNNAQKILITNEKFEKTGEITGFNSPRYIYEVGDNKAYVTDLYADKIWIVDLNNATISGSIKLNGWCEHAIISGNNFWVCNADANKIYRINTGTDILSDSVSVAYFPQQIVSDPDGNLWVMCRGDGLKRKAQFSVVETTNMSLVDSLIPERSPFACAVSHDHKKLLWVSDKLYYIYFDNQQETQVLFESALTSPYAMGVDPQNGEIYLSDVFDYTQKSTVFRLDASGNLLDEFKAGIISGCFYFNH